MLLQPFTCCGHVNSRLEEQTVRVVVRFKRRGGAPEDVASREIRARTQNGHIRNDTRDVSRRMSSVSNDRICRRNRVADDRACTRVTPRNLHGKEGVDGSSPSEGFEKCRKQALSCCLFVEHADTNRTHLRYARRTATSCDAFRHWFNRPGRAGRETKALLSTLDRCLRRRDRDPLSRERCSVAQPTSPVQPIERARMQGASATPGSAGRRPRIARRSATRRRCRAGRGVLARQLPSYTPYRLDVTRTLITGANRGLGFEVARQLVAAGHEVWVGERDEARGRQARAARQPDLYGCGGTAFDPWPGF